jgi:hypothetical protein
VPDSDEVKLCDEQHKRHPPKNHEDDANSHLKLAGHRYEFDHNLLQLQFCLGEKDRRSHRHKKWQKVNFPGQASDCCRFSHESFQWAPIALPGCSELQEAIVQLQTEVLSDEVRHNAVPLVTCKGVPESEMLKPNYVQQRQSPSS